MRVCVYTYIYTYVHTRIYTYVSYLIHHQQILYHTFSMKEEKVLLNYYFKFLGHFINISIYIYAYISQSISIIYYIHIMVIL